MRAVVLLLAMCAAASPSAAQPVETAVQAERMVTTPILRTRLTSSNQSLRLPQGDAELVAVAVDIPAGGATSIHQHPWSRFAYVEKGEIRVLNHDTGVSRDFKAGEVLSEAVGQWHEGRATSGPVRLIVFDIVPPGVINTVARPTNDNEKGK
jgi:quercetin dioxygenase-like cupin family protein